MRSRAGARREEGGEGGNVQREGEHDNGAVVSRDAVLGGTCTDQCTGVRRGDAEASEHQFNYRTSGGNERGE